MIATIVQTKELWQTVVASVVAATGVTFAFSVTIWGAGQFIELSRNERPLAAAGAAVVAVLALAFVVAAIVVGIVVMTHK
jgi:cation transporter-like permease